MPKMKTNRGTAKRFKITKKGKVMHRATNRNHILAKKAKGRKRHLRATRATSKHGWNLIKQLLKLK